MRTRGVRRRVALLMVVWALCCALLPVATVADGGCFSGTVHVVVDDFAPGRYQGDDVYFFNRLGGDRGPLQHTALAWGSGVVTATIGAGDEWGGMWMSLNHPACEGETVDLGTVVPSYFAERYHSRATELLLRVADATPGLRVKAELKHGGAVRWWDDAEFCGGAETLSFGLSSLHEVDRLVIVLDDTEQGEYCVLEEIALTVTNPIADPAEAAYVWSLGMWLNNWDPDRGMVRDRSNHEAGQYDAVQVTGALAAGVAQAAELDVLSHRQAVEIVNKIADTLMNDVPRMKGLWPHFCRSDGQGGIEIEPGTEWSTIDTAIAAMGLYLGQTALGLDTSETMAFMQAIPWDTLTLASGISHGYATDGTLLTASWDWFGGESWLLAFACAAASGTVPPIAHPDPPAYNGSGFIDELAWLYLPPPLRYDRWGADWRSYRQQAADRQIAYPGEHYPTSCVAQLGLFGLSAAEVPMPSAVAPSQIYRPFGVGGEAPPDDGVDLCGSLVVVPHYSAMIASLRPVEVTAVWRWLIDEGPFSPLNNVESLMFVGEGYGEENRRWNGLRGSWNLALQTLGWGRYLEQRAGQYPVLWHAALASQRARKTYSALAPGPWLLLVRSQHMPLAGARILW